MISNYLSEQDILILIIAIAIILVICLIAYLIFVPKTKHQEVIEEQTVDLDPVLPEDEEIVEEVAPEVVEEVVEEEKPQESEDNNQRTRRGKYEIFKDGDFYRFHLKASNGEILIESDIYITEQNALDAIEIIRKNIENGIYKIDASKNQMYQFSLSSRNHRLLAVSSFYSSRKSAVDACDAFKRNAITENIINLGDEIIIDNTMELFVDETIGNDNTGKYDVLPNGKKFYFVLKAPNGIVICHSQDFVSKTSCITGLEMFREVVYDGSFYITKDKNEKFQFKLYTKNNKLLLTSDAYETRNRVVSSIKLIKRYAKLANLDQ